MPWNEDIVFNIGAKSGYCYQTEGGATKPLSFEVEIGEKNDNDMAINSSDVTLKNIFAPFVSWVNSLSPFLDKLPEGLSVSDFTTKTVAELKAEGFVIDTAKQY
jgi:hypothetical protein